MQAGNSGTLLHGAKTVVSAVVLLALAACGSTNYPFNPMDKGQTYRPTSIAVISGSEEASSVKLAGFITDGLSKKSTFHVMSQQDIAKRIPNYPADIAINTKVKEGEEKPIWFPSAEKAKLSAIQAKLKVDYLYVVWNRFVRRVTVTGNYGGSTTDYVYPAGNLIEYPGGKVLASTMSVAGSELSPLALFRDKDYYIVDALKDASSDIVDEFTDVTKSRQ